MKLMKNYMLLARKEKSLKFFFVADQVAKIF